MMRMTRALTTIAVARLIMGLAWGAEEEGAPGGGKGPENKANISLEFELDRLRPLPLVPHPQIEFYTLRLEKPFQLSDHWTLETRCDLAAARSNIPSRDNPNADYEWGYSDSLAQGALVYAASKRWAPMAGLRTWWPTATQNELGFGKILMAPFAGLVIQLPEISKGSNFAPLVRYSVDVGGYGGRAHISLLQIRPMLNIELPKGFTATLFPSADIIVNLADHNKWFVPVDATLSKTVLKNTVLYVEIGVPIVNNFHYYDFKVASGVTVSF